MNTILHGLSGLKVTIGLLLATLAALFLLYCHLFWKRISPDYSQSSRSARTEGAFGMPIGAMERPILRESA